MNHVYRLVWNHRLSAYVPAAEFARGRGKKPSRLRALSAAVLASVAVTAHALPGGGQVTAGQGSIAQSGGAMTVTQQTPKLAIDWLSFGIGANEAVRFNQPSASSIALNRVLGQDPSQILGSLSANGQVFLLNPNGVLFAQGAQLNVGGIIASTLGLSNSDFMSGRYTFAKGASAGSVVNQGTLSAADGGYVALLGPQVRNEGVITAKLGTAALAAGNQVTVNLNGNSLVSLTVDKGALDALAQNKQLIQADGGTVIMTAKAADRLRAAMVNNEGVIEARTLVDKGGKIKLLADMDAGVVKVSGTLDASAPNGGDGGFIETSGAHAKVADSARITTAAAQGRTGLWLIDPADYTIAASGGDITGWALGSNLNSSNVTILSSQGTVNTNGNGDINVNDFVGWNANTNLNLSAERDVNVNTGLNFAGNAAGLNLISGRDVNIRDAFVNGSGNINVQSSGGLVVAATAGGAGLNTNGRIDIAAGSGVAVDAGTAPGAFAQIRSGSGQTIRAKSISVTARGGNPAEIQNGPTGHQVINIDGAGTGAGIDVINSGSGSGWATLSNFANGGAQTITLTNADHINVVGMAGPAQLTANGNQTISVTGGLSNSIQLGDPNAVGTSNISVTNNGATTQSVSAGGTISLSGGSAANGSWVQINSGGASQTISAHGIVLKGGSGGQNNNANIGGNNQSITVGSGGIQITGGAGGFNNTAGIVQGDASGTQTITVAGGDISVLGGAAGNWAQLGNNGTLQKITLTDNAHLNVIGGGEWANVNSRGDQTIRLTGAGPNAIQVGGVSSANSSWIGANGSQSITAGTGNQSGSITLQGGSVAGRGANIGANTQTISTSGLITLTGGSATGGTQPCYDQGSCVSINSNGSDPQSITAKGIVLQGGPSGENNNATISTNNGSSGQEIRVGSGGIQLLGGGGNSNNSATIDQSGASGAQTIVVTAGDILLTGGTSGTNTWAQISSWGAQTIDAGGGNISVIGGSGGTNNGAQVWKDSDGLQSIIANGIVIKGGSGGSNNVANINTNNWQNVPRNNVTDRQTLTVGTGGIQITGGGGGSNNSAAIGQNDPYGGAQSITVTGGDISVRGGAANTWAQIWNNGTSQDITLTNTDHLDVIAGGGSADLYSQGSQTINLTGTGARAIHIGSATSTHGSTLRSNAGAQSITAGLIVLQGGTGVGKGTSLGTGPLATTQTISTSGTITLLSGSAGGAGSNGCIDVGVCVSIDHGGSGLQTISASGIVVQGGTTNDYNSANIGNSFSSGGQTITVGSGGLQVIGGTVGAHNSAGIGNNNPMGQTIIVNDAASVSVIGNAGGANIGAGGDQTLLIQGAASANVLTVGSATSTASSSINGNNQSVTAGNTSQSGSITVIGGAGSGQNAQIWSNGGTQNVTTTGAINLTGGNATQYGSWAQINGNGAGQAISAGSIVMRGSSSGVNGNASIWTNGGAQTVNIYGGSLSLYGGGSLAGDVGNSATVLHNSPYGGQILNIYGGGSIYLKGGGGGDSVYGGNYANIGTWGNGGQAINFVNTSGSISLYGGSVGNNNNATIYNNGGASQTIGSSAVRASIYAQGGVSGANNGVGINDNSGSQTVYATSVTLAGAYGGGAEIIESSNANGQTQTINVTNALTLNGGPSPSTPFGGSRASISLGNNFYDGYGGWVSYGGTQQITAGSIALSGDTGGGAGISVAGNGTQTITSTGAMTLTGATSSSPYGGGYVNIGLGNTWYDGYGGLVASYGGTQQINAGSMTLAGGSGGIVSIGLATGTQNISVTGALALNAATTATNYGGGANINAGNGNVSATQTISAGSLVMRASTSGVNGNASIFNNSGAQTININGGSLSLYGGGSGAGDSQNSASINHNGPYGGQVFNIYGGGSIYLKGGDGGDSVYGGNSANIYTWGSGGQAINFFDTSGSISLYGGSVGSNNQASISNNGGGSQSIGSSAYGAAIYLQSGPSGTGNTAQISSGGNQSINVGSGGIQIHGGAGSSDNTASISQNDFAGTQTISLTNADRLIVAAGAGSATINSQGNQTISLTGSGSNAIQVGDSSSTQFSGITAGRTQSVIAGDAGESGSITITGGRSDGSGSFISNNSRGQNVATAGTITIVGGSAPSTGAGSGIATSGKGEQSITAKGLILVGGESGANNMAQIAVWRSDNFGQSITVGSDGISLSGGGGAGGNNSASVWNASTTGTQSITVTGGNVMLLGGSRNATNNASINSNAAQSIVLTDSDNLDIIAAVGSANISSSGTQTISIAGTGANAIQLGDASSLEFSGIWANGGQSITAGTGLQSGSITLVGGAATGKGVNIGTGGGATAQTISTSGTVSLFGGSAGGNGQNWCQDIGLCVSINHGGSGLQSIAANAIIIQGGASGSNNIANVNNNPGSAGQNFTVGGGGIQITGGGGTNNNAGIDGNGGNQRIDASSIAINGGAGSGGNNIAGIHQYDSVAGQTVTVTGAGGIALNGGSVGTNNHAEIVAAGPSQTISATGAGGISLTGGASGRMNYAYLNASNASAHQAITAGSGGIALHGGSGVGDSNWAFIFGNFNGSAAGGAIQNVTVNDGGALTLTGGNSTGGGSGVAITVAGVTQTIAVNGGKLTMTGGTSGTGNTANMQNQGVITANPAVAQNVTAGSITLTAGDGGTNSSVNMLSGGAQNVSTSGIIAIAGGADGTNNHAQINGSGDQQISASGIAIQGGAGTSYGNYAQIVHGGAGGNQTINVNGGAVVLQGGSGTGTTTNKSSLVPAVCAADPACLAQPVTSDWAQIYSAVGNQSITFLSPGTLSIAGGSGGNRNQASVSNGGTGTQTVSGAGPLDIALTGGSSGGSDFTSTDGVHYLRNNASIFSPYGAQNISGSSLTMKGAADLADAGSGNTGFSIYGKGQTIRIAGPISLEAGAGSSAAVVIISLADQAITGTTLALTAGMDGSGNRAAIEANGNQQVSLSGALMLSGGGGTGPAAGYNNYAQIRQLGAGAFSQSVTALNGIAIAGGSGDGMNGGTGDCGASCAGFSSSNNAGIYNAGSLGQTVSAGGAGILLYGGTLGNRNNAFIQNKSSGLQQIFSGSLWLQGGDSGGMDSRTLLSPAQSVFGSSYLTNNATITSGFYGLAGTQLINASTGAIALKGDSGSGSGMAGATITSVGTQTVFGGTIDLTGVGASPASIKSSNGSIDVVAGTSFSNHAGAGALSAPGGRWLLWAPAPSAVYSGGLVHDFVQYNASFTPTPTTPLASGNGLMYAIAPSLIPSFAAAVTKVYDGTTAVSGTTSLAATGAINGDAATIAAGSILYADKNAGSNKTVTASALSVSASDVAGKPVYGYLLPSTVSTATGEITPAILTLVGVRAYDGTVIFLPGTFGAAGTIAGVAGETLKLTGQGTVPSPNASTTPQPLSKGTLALIDGSGLASNYAIAASGNTGRITTDVPTSTASCKNGGWQFLSMIDGGATFRNQGQCIQFVNTGK